MQHPRLAVALLALNLPVYAAIWRAFFGDWSAFREAVYFWFTPRWLDWWRGELTEDSWANLKLLVFLLVCGLTVVSEYLTIIRHL